MDMLRFRLSHDSTLLASGLACLKQRDLSHSSGAAEEFFSCPGIRF
ncbi:MAG: hypothetical protein HDS49_00760 [Bacteroides sp.]|nr:hypothetical protein [Bacteroides sp.]